MRTRHTGTLAALRTRALLAPELSPLARAARPLATTTAKAFPRASRAPVRNASSTPSAPAPSAPVVDVAEPVELIQDPEGDGGEPSPSTPSFPAIATTFTTPSPPTDPLPEEHHLLFNHLATSFLPSNQPCVSPPAPERPQSPMAMHMMGGPGGPGGPGRGSSAKKEASAPTVEDPVLALVCPFEGGEAYISQAVNDVAAHLTADVVRIDLALAVGFDGPHAPLAETGLQAPSLAPTPNPLFHSPVDSDQQTAMNEEEMDVEDDENAAHNIIRIPLFTANVGAIPIPGGMVGGHGAPSRRPEDNEEWVSFFTSLINMQLPEGVANPANRRIILLESTAAMAETFSAWWPSLLEAVRQRRRGPAPKGKGKRAASVTTSPTTIVLSIPPSLLLPHTAHVADAQEGSAAEDAKARIRSVAEAIGANIGALNVDSGDKGEEKLWWSSEEHDHDGRQQREERRLRAILNHGPTALLPFSSSSQSQQPATPANGNLMDMLMGGNKKKDEAVDASLAWKTLSVIPSTRDTGLEQYERTRRRRAVNAAVMMRAVGQLGATLQEPLSMLDAPGSLPPRGRERRLKRRKEPDPEWSEYVISWKDAMDLASTAVGRASATGEAKDEVTLKWEDIQVARAVTFNHNRSVEETLQQYLAASNIASAHRERRAAPEPTVADPVVEAVKKTKDLSKHEKRLLGCIVDPTKLATSSFKDVHLPFKTIDAIRSVISLPLLFPEAFKGGILKDHVTSGALLFGPPGTGKTLLARAVAAESGARMLAIQPSDVNDMWVGEGEKLVKAVFNLARRLSPCVVFIDEVDSLFGARSARDSGGGSKAHNQVLTEFMQEMDGLSSSYANREKRIVVMGATNRPFDLDDAVLRRLPRRLLVDLPTKEDRKAILQILLRDESVAADVDLDKLAAETEGFSGSDLKHLCVAAALAAVKDIVKVPWKNAQGVVPTPVEGPPPSRPSGGHREAVAVDVPELPEAEKLVPIPELSAPAQLVEETYLRQLEARAQDESAAAAAAAKGEGKVEEGAVGKEAAEETGAEEAEAATATAETETAETNTTSASTASIPTRTVTAAHFNTALNEIRPSSSEEGTLPELRKWAELYGEGGREKGKKSGFGKGFGFGDEPLAKRKGYGRVGEEGQA